VPGPVVTATAPCVSHRALPGKRQRGAVCSDPRGTGSVESESALIWEEKNLF